MQSGNKMEKEPITINGLEKLKEELIFLKEKKRPKIVGKDEADLKKKLIYFQSPIGKGLIGKNKNDLVEITTPAGIKNFEIKDVKYV